MNKRILVVDSVPTERIKLRVILKAAQYDVDSVETIDALKEITLGKLDGIILNTSSGEPDQTIFKLRKHTGSAAVPILCRDGDAGPVRRIAALAAGAVDVVPMRAPEALLLARLRVMLRDADTVQELDRRRVAAKAFGFSEASSRFAVPQSFLSVDLCSADENLPAIPTVPNLTAFRVSSLGLLSDDGLEQKSEAIMLRVSAQKSAELEVVLPEIRMRKHLKHLPVVVEYPPEQHKIAIRALNQGATEIVEQGALGEELSHRLSRLIEQHRIEKGLRHAEEEGRRLATIDPLTGLYNRRYADVYLSNLSEELPSKTRSVAALMIDIDYFKKVNDQHGHGEGDRVIQEVAARIRDSFRARDLVARYGGEEFLVVVPDIGEQELLGAANRTLSAIAGEPITLTNKTELNVTVSIGAALAASQSSGRSGFQHGPGSPADTREILERADHALYKSKTAGRNCVTVNPPVSFAAQDLFPTRPHRPRVPL